MPVSKKELMKKKREVIQKEYDLWIADMLKKYPDIQLKPCKPYIVGDRSDNMSASQRRFIPVYLKNEGVITTACKEFKISRATFYLWKGNCREFSDKIDEIDYKRNDDEVLEAEKTLSVHVKENQSLKAAIYVLDNKGQDRGWGVSSQVKTGNITETIHYILSFEDNDNEKA